MVYETAETWIKSGKRSDITVTCLDDKDNIVDFKCHKLIIFPFLTQSCLSMGDDYDDVEHVILPDVSSDYFKKFLNDTSRKLENSNKDFFDFFSPKHVVESPAAKVELKIECDNDVGGGYQGGEGGGNLGNDVQNQLRSVKTTLIEKHENKLVKDRNNREKENVEKKVPIKTEFMKEETTSKITEKKNRENSILPLKTDVLESTLFQCTFCTAAFPITNYKMRNQHMLDVHYSELEQAGRIYTKEGGKKTHIKWYSCDYGNEGCVR